MDDIDQDTYYQVTVTPQDEDGNPITPASAQYTIDCYTSQTGIKGVTAISPLQSSMEVTVTAAENKIVNEHNPYEERQMVVTVTDGAGKQLVTRFSWRIRNTRFRASP